MALVLGLAAGFAAAYLLERLDDKIRSAEQVELITGLPILGVIPKVSDVEARLADPRSALSRSLPFAVHGPAVLNRKRFAQDISRLRAPGHQRESRSRRCAIAKHFATLGRKVLLIDADLRNPSLHMKLDCDNSVGLSNCLTGACTPPEAMQKTEIPNLAFIAHGPLPPNAADLLGGARLHSLLSIGSEVFDLIVIDGPPVLGLADAQLLSSAAAATIFVVGAGQARTGLVRGALRHLTAIAGVRHRCGTDQVRCQDRWVWLWLWLWIWIWLRIWSRCKPERTVSQSCSASSSRSRQTDRRSMRAHDGSRCNIEGGHRSHALPFAGAAHQISSAAGWRADLLRIAAGDEEAISQATELRPIA